jgi:hypothetical protein
MPALVKFGAYVLNAYESRTGTTGAQGGSTFCQTDSAPSEARTFPLAPHTSIFEYCDYYFSFSTSKMNPFWSVIFGPLVQNKHLIIGISRMPQV